jgi:hypothetical protein
MHALLGKWQPPLLAPHQLADFLPNSLHAGLAMAMESISPGRGQDREGDTIYREGDTREGEPGKGTQYGLR